MNQNNKYLTLVRREVWEHRALWVAPAVAAGLLLCAAIFGALHFGNGVHITVGPVRPPSDQRFGAASLLGVTAAIGLFAGIVTLAYLLDCLLAERKDRSILFWKSLPVSDTETVLVKLVVAMLLVPLLVLALAALLQPLLAIIVALRFPELRPHIGQLLGESFGALPYLLVPGIFGLLWFLPVAAYLMLASVLARRTAIMYAVLPPVALGVAEGLLFGTKHVLLFVAQRLVPWPLHGPILVDVDPGGVTLIEGWWKAFGDPALWLGLVAAAAMIYGVIRLRRYRDDT